MTTAPPLNDFVTSFVTNGHLNDKFFNFYSHLKIALLIKLQA